MPNHDTRIRRNYPEGVPAYEPRRDWHGPVADWYRCRTCDGAGCTLCEFSGVIATHKASAQGDGDGGA
jgi:hypothetical protein